MTLTEVEPDSGWVSPSHTSLSVLGWSSAPLKIPAALTLLVGWGLEFLGGLGESLWGCEVKSMGERKGKHSTVSPTAQKVCDGLFPLGLARVPWLALV